MPITRQKFRYLVVLYEKFLTKLTCGLIPQIDYVLLRVGINVRSNNQQLTG